MTGTETENDNDETYKMCIRDSINSSLLSKAMGDEKTKQWLEYNLSLIPKDVYKRQEYYIKRYFCKYDE